MKLTIKEGLLLASISILFFVIGMIVDREIAILPVSIGMFILGYGWGSELK